MFIPYADWDAAGLCFVLFCFVCVVGAAHILHYNKIACLLGVQSVDGHAPSVFLVVFSIGSKRVVG